MKTKAKPEMDPVAAFPQAKQRPTAAALLTALGAAASPLDEVLAAFRRAHPDVSTAWQFSERAGWYQLLMLKKRRLLYLVPQRGNFRAMMILGGKALDQLKAGPQARPTARRLKTARHYPEGTAFTFTRDDLDPGLLAAFLAAKLDC